MRRVDRASFGQRLRQAHHFFGGRRKGVGVGKACRQAERAVGKRLAQLRAHAFNLASGGGAVETVQMVIAQCRVADQRGNVHRRLRVFDGFHVRREGRVRKRAGRSQQVHRIGRVALERGGRRADAAVAHDHRRNALRHLAQHVGRADHVGVVVRMHVDEAGGEDAAFASDFLIAQPGGGVRCGDGGDAAVGDGDVEQRGLGVVAAAVHNADLTDDGVVLLHVNLRAADDCRRRDAHRART